MFAMPPARDEPLCQKKDCSPYDIGLVLKNMISLAGHEKATNWKPTELFEFPGSIENGKSRKLNLSWLKRFPWLVSHFLEGNTPFRNGKSIKELLRNTRQFQQRKSVRELTAKKLCFEDKLTFYQADISNHYLRHGLSW